ncbi:GH3 auxin-responsive promoter family protein [Nitrosomonas sp.]|uniref:GH3 auxin-responsive promoter family protein n=1 Tax=Nitrosomonas sp. TaxID=42353 RepID=UPI002852CA28|nr:GH3 auxin-responsive promoter family protein [Nitrosomonas sp.]
MIKGEQRMDVVGMLLSRLLISLKMFWIRHFYWRPLINQTFRPQQVQEKLLQKILDRNKQTDFGKTYGFAAIKNYHDYRQALPVQTYETLRCLIERQEGTRSSCLNAGQPVLYAQTSGTTGRPKYIPIFPKTLDQYRRSQHCAAYAIYSALPRAYAGKLLAVVSPAIEGYLPTGTPYGSMSGLIYRSMPQFVTASYVIPMQVLELDDYALKYHLIAVFALAEQNITMMATANPSTLLKIVEIINARWDTLIQEVAIGNTYGLVARPQRSEMLKTLNYKKGKIVFADIWPNLQVVTTWTGGSCSVLIPSLQKQLSSMTRIVEMGYLSSEFRGSLTIDAVENRSILAIHENFFEFVERDRWEDKSREFLTVSALQTGKQYYVFVTTQNGLFRYFIDDIIEVEGWYNHTPTIRFVQKGKGVVNLTGEKLYENQVIHAVCAMMQRLKIEPHFFIMLGNPDLQQYTLYIATEPFTDASAILEKYLSDQNIEFAAKRQSGRLRQTIVRFVSGAAADAYKKYCIEQGQRESQFKLQKLQSVYDCGFDFENYEIDRYAA